MKLPAEDTEVSYCWWCRKFHIPTDYWCPPRWTAKIIDVAFDWYLKAAVLAMIAVFIVVMLAQLR